MEEFGLRVIGLPAPKGSKTAFVVKGRAIITDKIPMNRGRNTLAPWKVAISAALQEAVGRMPGFVPFDAPLDVTLIFFLPRPATAAKRIEYPAKKPDCDKLARAALDVCTKILWADDARITTLSVQKRFAIGQPPGMLLIVRLEGDSLAEAIA